MNVSRYLYGLSALLFLLSTFRFLKWEGWLLASLALASAIYFD